MDFQSLCSKFFNNDTNIISNIVMSFQQQVKQSNNKMTKSSMINYIINSKQFQEYYEKIFFEVVRKLIPKENINNSFSILKQKFLREVIQTSDECSESSIESFIKNSEAFESIYSNIIENTYNYYYNSKLVENEKKDLLNYVKSIKFLEIESETINSLIVKEILRISTDINSKQEDLEINYTLNEYNEHFEELYKTKYKKEPCLRTVTEFQDFMKSKKHIIDLYFYDKYTDYSKSSSNIIEIFYNIFNRDITVFEYIKYFAYFSDDEQNMTNKIKEYHHNFDKKYNIIFSVYSDFLNKKIDYNSFVKNYLELIEQSDSDFRDLIIARIVEYSSYDSVMKEKIKKIYTNTYTIEISNLDLLYFYHKVHNEKYSLIDEKLPQIITSLKEETDQYVSKINTVSNSILLRDAEHTEIEEYINYFRNNHDNNLKPEIKLENELYESLEYHDILKDIINKYGEKTNKKLTKSNIFTMLQYLLNLDDSYIKRDSQKIFKILESKFK